MSSTAPTTACSYAIRRGRHDESAAERVRLSEATHEIQGRLSYYVAWTATESSIVATPTPHSSANCATSKPVAVHLAAIAPAWPGYDRAAIRSLPAIGSFIAASA
jgi:hypothetical protein